MLAPHELVSCIVTLAHITIEILHSDSCCGGSDNSSDTDNGTGVDTDTDTEGDNSDTDGGSTDTDGGNSTDATDVTTEMENSDSGASQIGVSVLALVLARFF